MTAATSSPRRVLHAGAAERVPAQVRSSCSSSSAWCWCSSLLSPAFLKPQNLINVVRQISVIGILAHRRDRVSSSRAASTCRSGRSWVSRRWSRRASPSSSAGRRRCTPGMELADHRGRPCRPRRRRRRAAPINGSLDRDVPDRALHRDPGHADRRPRAGHTSTPTDARSARSSPTTWSSARVRCSASRSRSSLLRHRGDRHADFMLSDTQLRALRLRDRQQRDAVTLVGHRHPADKVLIYMFSGLLAGLGGVVLSARIGSGDPTLGRVSSSMPSRPRSSAAPASRVASAPSGATVVGALIIGFDEHRTRPAQRVAVLAAGRQGRHHRRRDHHRRAQEPELTRPDVCAPAGPRQAAIRRQAHRGASGHSVTGRPSTRARPAGHDRHDQRRGAVSPSRRDHAVTDLSRYPRLLLGTAPDSWGVWFADEPVQVPGPLPRRGRDAGYRWTELGPFGYLPTDPGIVRDEYEKRGLTLTGGTVFAALHKGRDALEQAKADCDAELAIIGPSGARHLVILPEGYTDLDGNLTASPELTDDEWHALTTGHVASSADTSPSEHGAILMFHTHADSHVGTQAGDRAFPRRHGPGGRAPVPGHRPCGLLRRGQPASSSATTPTASPTSTSSRSTRRSGRGYARRRWASRPPCASGSWSSHRSASPTCPR